jgi:methyltransferase family protein
MTESEIDGKAYAVDTWQGDIHTGAYGNEVFDEVAAYNRSRYAEFSQLMRMLFDEAIEHFESGTIDLLHIDGIHTYEAVRHDFETWWPKVRRGGIVLLHDTFKRNTDFGVWKLLNELSQELPTAEFRHSNGLGVILKPGATPGPGLIPLLFSREEDAFERLRRYYEICADHLEHQFWSERRRNPADWDVVTQLFWRTAGENFTEPASVRSSRTITRERSRLVLPVPRMAAPPVELRLDLADCSAFFEVHAIALLDANGQMLWQWAEARDIDQLRSRGLHAVAAPDGTGVLVLDAPTGASFLLPAPESVVRDLQSGGQLIVEATGLAPSSFISKLATGFEQQLTRQQANLEEIQTALNHAQRVAWEKEEKLKLLDEQTRAALGERERELADLAGQLGQIESSLVWRAVRPLTGFQSRNKK